MTTLTKEELQPLIRNIKQSLEQMETIFEETSDSDAIASHIGKHAQNIAINIARLEEVLELKK